MTEPIALNLRAFSDDGRAWALPEHAAAQIDASGLAAVRIGPARGTYRLATGARVGVATGDGWEVRVRSHLDVGHLMFLLTYARNPDGWKDTLAGFTTAPDLVASVGNAMASLTERAFRRGVLHGYRRIEERTPVLRGRLLVGAQMARGGLPTPLDIERDDYAMDTDEHRLLLAALRLLERLPDLQPQTHLRIRRLVDSLDGVTHVLDAHRLVRPRTTRLNQHYRPALTLADIVLHRQAPTHAVGATVSTTFAFDLHTVFEEFLEVALTRALERHGLATTRQDGSRHLDAGNKLHLIPDLVVRRGDACASVVDAKFKHLTAQLGGDAYQMLAYLLEFRASRGFLVAAEAEPADHRIGSADKVVSVRRVDLSGRPADVLGSVAALAAEIAATA
ncbi:MAG: hypothetical protein AAGC46_19590 [Solirubrobacteraceae bacterium]|nr:hypothetical protein [Patulibacter sp.]